MLVEILRFLVTSFSQPIAEALRSHGFFPPPRWPRDPTARDETIVAHVFAGMREVCPSWTPHFGALDFLLAREHVAARITLVLDLVKRLCAIHNRVVSANLAHQRALRAREEQGATLPPAPDPFADEARARRRNDSDESDSSTSRASSGAARPAEQAAFKPPARWLATEYFNDDEIALYHDQLQCAPVHRRAARAPAPIARARARAPARAVASDLVTVGASSPRRSSLSTLSAMAATMNAEVACLRSTLRFLGSRGSARSAYPC